MIAAGLSVPGFFTTRAGGVSAPPYDTLNLADHVGDRPAAVKRNRDIVAEAIGAPVSVLQAEHGIGVALIGAPGERPPPADVLVTVTPGVALATISADCVPVLMHDHASGAVAVAHAGREGLFKGVIDAAVAALHDLRGGWKTPGEMEAAIGPAICGGCYEVPAEMRAHVASRHPAATASTRQGTPSLDLPRAVEARLDQLGFSSITRIRRCAYEDADFFSHRRDGATGRCAGVVRCG